MTLTFELLTLKRVTRVMGFRGLLVLDLGRGTGRTDRRLPSTLNAPSNYSVATMSISCTELRSVILTVFFLSPGDAVWPIALNFAWTERHCHACKTPRSMYPSIYNSFPVTQTTIAKKIAIFTYPGFHFLFALGRPCGNHAKRCMNEKTIQCLPNPSQHVPIYLQQFPSYSNRKCKKSPFSRTAAHIFVSPGDAPAIITQYVAWMERQFNACQTPRSIYLFIFNSFRVIRCWSQCVSPNVAIFTTFLFPLGTPLGESR